MSNKIHNYQQISVYKTNKNVLELNCKLQEASDKYCNLHRKNERTFSGIKLPDSLIGIVAIDYSKETSVRVEDNLTPSEIKYLYSIVKNKPDNFSLGGSRIKVFGEPDENGLSIVRKTNISRQTKMPDGSFKKYPWSIKIENGRGKKNKKDNGSIFLEYNSYIKDKEVNINLTDLDLFELLDAAVSTINIWEFTYGPNHLIKHYEITKENSEYWKTK